RAARGCGIARALPGKCWSRTARLGEAECGFGASFHASLCRSRQLALSARQQIARLRDSATECQWNEPRSGRSKLPANARFRTWVFSRWAVVYGRNAPRAGLAFALHKNVARTRPRELYQRGMLAPGVSSRGLTVVSKSRVSRECAA